MCHPPRSVDLVGRLSNPLDDVKDLVSQGLAGPKWPQRTSHQATRPAPIELGTPSSKEVGRLSNPVQRRLSTREIRKLAELYRCGISIKVLAIRYHIHRTTVIHHLIVQDVPRRRTVRKLRDLHVTNAAELYASGLSLATVAAMFDVHEATLTREFRAANVPIRPRRGWTK